MGKSRKSGIELLRILAALGVVVLHYNDGRAFGYVQGGINLYVLQILECVCICAVDLFVLISGYFLSNTPKRNYFKIIELVIELIIIKELWYVGLCLFTDTSFAWKKFLVMLVPNNYFVVLYATLYIISPYLNRIFADFNKQQWNRFIITLLALFSAWTTLVDLAEEVLDIQMVGLSTVTMYGSHKGFNIVNFALMYFVGAYLRHQQVPKIINTRGKQFITMILTLCVMFIWAWFVYPLPRKEMGSSWMYHNPLVILMAVLLFLLFSSFDFEKKWINELAKAAFTCFLLHAMMLDFVGIEKYSTGNVFVMLVHIVVVVVFCYICSYIVYKIYNCTIGKILSLIENAFTKKQQV